MKTNRKSNGRTVATAVLAAVLLMGAPAYAAETEDLWNQANQAYSEGNWQQAIEGYRAIGEAGYQSSDLYFNIGNAFFKSGDNARAILFYEKALKLNPGNEDAASNLEVARQFTLDKIESIPDFFLAEKARKLGHTLDADGWAVLSLSLLFVVAVLLLVFRSARSGRSRRISFICAVVVLLLSATSFIFSLSLKKAVTVEDSAIVVSPVSSVKSSPSDGGNSIFVLHEGTKVKLLDSVGDWTRIEIADGRQGWLTTSTIENI